MLLARFGYLLLLSEIQSELQIHVWCPVVKPCCKNKHTDNQLYSFFVQCATNPGHYHTREHKLSC